MKNKALGFVFTVLLSIGTFAAPVMASDYLGEVCFRAVASDSSTRMMKLGISHMGGYHFQMAGTWNWEDGRRSSAPINGNLEIIDNNLVSTFTFSFYTDREIRYRVGHLELDVSSLSGTLRMVNYKIPLTTGSGAHGKSTMPVSFISCP